MFKKALLYKHNIRDCVVRLDRLAEVDTVTDAPKEATENLRLTPSNKSLRSNVSWFPTQKKSSEAMVALEAYRNEIDFVPTVTGKNVIRQRAKSMYIETAQLNDSNGNTFTMDDLHLEFLGKFNSPNRGLKPVSVRQLAEAQPKPISQFQKIFNEFKEKMAAKNAQK